MLVPTQPQYLVVLPQIAGNKEGKVICEIDSRVLVGMQFGVLVEVLCESDGRVLRGMQFGLLVEVLFCKSDGWVRCWGHTVWGAGGNQRLEA